MVLQNLKRSVRKQAAALRVSGRTLHRGLHKDLDFQPYKVMIILKLNEGDFAKRLQFGRMKAIFNDGKEPVIMMGDETHFHLCGSVNIENCIYWAAENLRELHQRPLHSSKVTV